MSTKLKFDIGYQRSVISLMLQDFGFLSFVSHSLLPEAFDTRILGWFYTKVRDYFLDYNKRPTRKYLLHEVKKAFEKNTTLKKQRDLAEVKLVLAHIKQPIADADYVKDEVQSFLRHQAIKNAMLNGVALLKSERYDELGDMLQEALRVGQAALDPGVQYFKDYQERLSRRRKERLVIPTGIQGLDKVLKHGGVGEKELALLLAPPGVGKSMGLLFMGKSAVLRRKKVVIYTLEMSEDLYAERWDTSFSGVDMGSVNPDLGRVYKRLNKLSNTYQNSLIIKEFPPGSIDANGLLAHINILQSHFDFDPDLVIVDYVELMRPHRKRDSLRMDIGQAVMDLRAIAVKLKIPIWSAVQANREALSKKRITIKDLSESFEPAKHADIIIALCQTQEELENREMRLFVAKNRNYPGRTEIPIVTAYERSQFSVRNPS